MRSINRRSSNLQTLDFATNDWYVYGGQVTLSYAPGMDVRTSVPLNADALLTPAQQGATGNAAEGLVQNLNQLAHMASALQPVIAADRPGRRLKSNGWASHYYPHPHSGDSYAN